jgi:hypothetical protein
MAKTHTIVPAQPGWYIVRLNGKNKLVYETIIAWEIASDDNDYDDCEVIPLTIRGRPLSRSWAVKTPNNKFQMIEGELDEAQTIKTLQGLEREEMEERERKHERKIAAKKFLGTREL